MAARKKHDDTLTSDEVTRTPRATPVKKTTAKMYTIDQAIEAMGVDANTLRLWLDKAQVQRVVDPVNNRRRLVPLADLKRVATAHGRKLLDPGEVRMTMEDQIAELRKQIADLQRRMDTQEQRGVSS